MKGSASGYTALADIISALMILVVIFALIFALGQNWGTFFMFAIVGGVMMFFSKFLRRL